MPGLSAEQVLALAPDAASTKAGRDLAARRHWLTAGGDGRAVWGECQGSGRLPYQVQADLEGPAALAYRCTCPSRKLPCKHSLGLLLLLAQQPDAIDPATPPAWVAEWLAARESRTSRRASPPVTLSEPAAVTQESESLGSTRLATIAAGLEEFERWLEDLARLGLAAAAQQPASFWERAAARLVDAQAPGLAGLVRELAGLPSSGPGWEERLLARLGRMYLLSQGFGRLETLPEAGRADVLAALGVTVRQEELLAGPACRDWWYVAGRRTEPEGRLTARRTWLHGRDSGREALLLEFAHGREPFAPGYQPGVGFDADLVFYPSAWPLRAIVKVQHAQPKPAAPPAGYTNISGALAACARALGCNPWLKRLPLALSGVVPGGIDGAWTVADVTGQALPLSPRFNGGWPLVALSGGQPLDLFGEWDGTDLFPLGARADGEYWAL